MKTYTYTIYHIPGIKIGATTEIEKRIKDQGFSKWEILETYEGDFELGRMVGDREIELQIQYFGKRDNARHYQDSRITRNLASSHSSPNRYKWNSEQAKAAAKIGNESAWTTHSEKMLAAAQENIKKATEAAAISPNRPALRMYKCLDCDREIKGVGPATRHRNISNHRIERI